jgi:glycosyltransferase involved in cell wall biosynthesis
VAFRNGSVPEAIDDGLTGWIVDTEDDMVAALDRLGESQSHAVPRGSRETLFVSTHGGGV